MSVYLVVRFYVKSFNVSGIRNEEEMEAYLTKWYEERLPAIQQRTLKVPPV